MIHKDFRYEFYFIRHGESRSNATPGFAAGVDFDAPLTEKGVDQARKLGRRLRRDGARFDRVYSSTMKRAVRTAEGMFEGMGEPNGEYTQVPALIEQQIPGWRGVREEVAYTPETVALMRTKGLDFVPPEGESHRTVQRRVAGWLEDEIIYNQDLVGKAKSLTVCVVGHGAAFKCLFQYIMGYDDRFVLRLEVDNCSISRFGFDRGGWSVLCINDSYHLNGS